MRGFGNTPTSPSPPPQSFPCWLGSTKVHCVGYYWILPEVLDMLLYVLVMQKMFAKNTTYVYIK